MKETARLENIEAMYAAFSDERLRWLMGKGDLLVQKGELDEDRFQHLIAKTVRDEYVRNLIMDAIRNGYRTVTDISNTTRFQSSIVVTSLLALMKWNKIEIVEQRGQEYLYALTEEAE